MFKAARARSLSVAVLVALHALVSVGGAGLHALPGWDHGSAVRPAAKNDHSHGPGKSSHQAADECPVCQFLAEGRAAPQHDAGPSDCPVAAADETANSLLRAPASHSLCSPRAPPAGQV